MAFFREIAVARTAAGRLWQPQLSLDLMGRDWALIRRPLDIHIPTTSRVGTGTVSVDFTVCYPETWALDTSFAAMAARLTVMVVLTLPAATTADIGIVSGGSSEITGPVTSQPVYLARQYTTLPTGPTTETILLDVTVGAGTSTFNHSIGVRDGPVGHIEIVAA